MTPDILSNTPLIGVGLRHNHVEEALATSAPIDFVEVHSENFFAEGGAARQIIIDIAASYHVSLHSTAMGLGSAVDIPAQHLSKLNRLKSDINPFLMSDHACFTWGVVDEVPVHSGDLLPLVYDTDNLEMMARHVDKIQQHLGRQLLIENLSAYLSLPGSTMTEQEFLSELCNKTHCGLLLDLNNILVNAYNQGEQDQLAYGLNWLKSIPYEQVGEIHLAGYRPVDEGQIAVDDHSQPVSDLGWTFYEQTIALLGNVPTLIEWDNDLPTWDLLLEQAEQARRIATRVLNNG